MTTIKPMKIAARVPHCPCNDALVFSSLIILVSKFCIGTSIVDEIVKWVIANIERIISIVAIIASYFIGVYSNRRNDRRKEFNAVADHLHIRLVKAKEDLESGLFTRRPPVSRDDILTLSIHTKGRNRDRLMAAYDEFNDSISQISWNKYGTPTAEDGVKELIIEKIKALIALTEHK